MVNHAAATLKLEESTKPIERRLLMSSPLQVAVLVLLGAALWGIFYIINVLSQEKVEPKRKRRSARRSLEEGENDRALDT